MNAQTALLTARTARRRGPPGRAFASNAPLRGASKQKTQPLPERAFDPWNKPQNRLLSLSAKSSPHPPRSQPSARQGRPPEFLKRHASGDWGDLCQVDHTENQFGLERGFQIFSSYRTDAGDELWIITDNHFSITTILLPKEY